MPVPLHLCADPAVIGAPFYLMSYVDGVVLRGEAEIARLSPEDAARTGDLLVATLAALHATDPAAVGLADFGRPDGYLERQVRRWHEQWERSKTRDLRGARGGRRHAAHDAADRRPARASCTVTSGSTT